MMDRLPSVRVISNFVWESITSAWRRRRLVESLSQYTRILDGATADMAFALLLARLGALWKDPTRARPDFLPTIRPTYRREVHHSSLAYRHGPHR